MCTNFLFFRRRKIVDMCTHFIVLLSEKNEIVYTCNNIIVFSLGGERDCCDLC